MNLSGMVELANHISESLNNHYRDIGDIEFLIEELIADRNIRIVSQALIEMINSLRSVSVCGSFEYSYIRKLAEKVFDKYGEDLQEIVKSGNGI